MVPGVGLEPDTVFPPGDFESPASTNFATRAGLAYAKASILPKARTSYNSRPFFIWSVKPMLLSDFDYDLPERLIAQQPSTQRDGSRLLHVRPDGLDHLMFSQLQGVLRPGDLLVLNNTKVVKARLHGKKETGGAAEILLERVLEDGSGASNRALCQVRVSKPLQEGRHLLIADQSVVCLGREGEFYLLQFPQPVFDFLQSYGELPLPPYIQRDAELAEPEQDAQRYQTVFAAVPGAVAAPTAGLHFSEGLLAQLQSAGINSTTLTLHVGAGTFQPVRVNDLAQHQMHLEHYQVPEKCSGRYSSYPIQWGRVVAVGTTVVRALESAALASGRSRLVLQRPSCLSPLDLSSMWWRR